MLEQIRTTATRTDLKVECALDERICRKGIGVSKAEIAALDIAADSLRRAAMRVSAVELQTATQRNRADWRDVPSWEGREIAH